MTPAEKIKFVNENQSVEHFEKDVELYKKIYPNSRLIPELLRATQYNMRHLDGRILLEMLEVVCGETVLENRGIIRDNEPDNELFLNTFIQVDLDTTSYQDRKAMVKKLEIKTADQKSETLLKALKDKQQQLKAEPLVDLPAGSTDPLTETGDVDPEKKSEDPG